jgi:4-amino-4-deoxy-L-arabinose transferase-like glycosyltransferase
LFAKRLARPGYSLGIAALMAFAPTQLHMSQHGLADGFFTFWVTLILWSLWENFRSPGDWRWLSLLIGALAAIVLTKENAFFVWLGMIAILIANRWLRWGRITRELILAVFLGPTLGVVMLIFLAGGIPELLATYHLSVTKNYELEYAVLTGDGPWYRYLVDLLLVSPVVLLLAICSVFRLTRDSKVEWFFFIFIAATYAIMCNIKYGMNLRYANMWDLPLRVLAVGQLATFAGLANRRSNIVMAVSVLTVCAIEFQQYIILAVNFPLYELITPHLLRAFGILKDNLGP